MTSFDAEHRDVIDCSKCLLKSLLKYNDFSGGL